VLKPVVWNGPWVYLKCQIMLKEQLVVCEAIAKLNRCNRHIIGGGDFVQPAAMELGFADQFTHISYWWRSFLEYLEGKELPGVASNF